MAIGLFIAAALVFVFALAVAFAGAGRILNFVEYDKVGDARALHAWAGRRLFALAGVTAMLGGLAFRWPGLAIFFLIAFIAACLVFVSWLMVGAGRFQR